MSSVVQPPHGNEWSVVDQSHTVGGSVGVDIESSYNVYHDVSASVLSSGDGDTVTGPSRSIYDTSEASVASADDDDNSTGRPHSIHGTSGDIGTVSIGGGDNSSPLASNVNGTTVHDGGWTIIHRQYHHSIWVVV